MLELADIRTFHGHVEALKGVSLNIREGEIVCLIGANGAGKTTVLMTISGILRPSAGRIDYFGTRCDRLDPHEIVSLGITHVPEGRRIFPRLSVEENLEIGAYSRRDPAEISADKEKMFSIFPILRDRRGQRGGTLSGGEQQMLAIARALMARPTLLLLDEPSLGLAPKFVEKIFEKILEVNRQGTTILLVEQNASMALSISARGYVLETGKITLAGSAPSLIRDPSVRAAYLGGS